MFRPIAIRAAGRLRWALPAVIVVALSCGAVAAPGTARHRTDRAHHRPRLVAGHFPAGRPEKAGAARLGIRLLPAGRPRTGTPPVLPHVLTPLHKPQRPAAVSVPKTGPLPTPPTSNTPAPADMVPLPLPHLPITGGFGLGVPPGTYGGGGGNVGPLDGGSFGGQPIAGGSFGGGRRTGGSFGDGR